MRARLPRRHNVALAAEFDVSQSTASRALARLRTEGLVYVISGRGYFVSEPQQSQGVSEAL
ncbi:GntR family transcriptional regulator [Streptomyces sp. CA-106131]